MASVITIPLQIISLQGEGFHLLVEVFVFGEVHFAVLDTGASRSVFDKSLIEKHLSNAIVVNELQANTLFSTAETIQAVLPVLHIGKLKIKNYPAMAIDLSSVTETYAQFGHPAIAAIIGSDILMDYNARIDYAKKTLKLTRSKSPVIIISPES